MGDQDRTTVERTSRFGAKAIGLGVIASLGVLGFAIPILRSPMPFMVELAVIVVVAVLFERALDSRLGGGR